MTRSRRGSRILLVVLLVLMVNLPLAHSTWTHWRLEQSGVPVTAEVTDSRVIDREDGPAYWLELRFPERVDPERLAWAVEVDRTTYDAAVAAGTAAARVLEDRPAVHRVEGQVRHRFGLVTTLAVDAVLLLVVLLAWRASGRRRPEPVRLSAVGDVEGCPPGTVLEQIDGTLYLVRGEVTAVDDAEITLDLGDCAVVVQLDGHAHGVRPGEAAQVRGRILG